MAFIDNIGVRKKLYDPYDKIKSWPYILYFLYKCFIYFDIFGLHVLFS